MVIDTSAFVAILRPEPEAVEFAEILAFSDERHVTSAVTLIEAGLVLSREELDLLAHRLIPQLRISIISFDENLANIAIDAAHRYGKGRGGKAQLNFGDCCVYATAKALRMPLLFKGSDFLHTDIEPARPMQR